MGMNPAPAHQDFPRVWLIEASEKLDESRLAGPVLADKGVDFAWGDCQVDAVQRERAEKALREIPDLNRGKRIGHHDVSSNILCSRSDGGRQRRRDGASESA